MRIEACQSHMCFLPGFRINRRACSIGRFTTCRRQNFVRNYTLRDPHFTIPEGGLQPTNNPGSFLQFCSPAHSAKPPARGGAQGRAVSNGKRQLSVHGM